VTSYMYVEVTSYLYVFAPDYATAQQSWHWGRHQLRPVGLAMVICQVLAFLGLGLVPTADSPDPGPPDIPPATSTWAFYLNPEWEEAFFHKNLPPQLTAAAGNYTYVNLRISAGEMLLWRPGTSSLLTCTTYLALSVHVDLASGTLDPLGRASKFLSSPLGSPMDVLRFFMTPQPSSTLMWAACHNTPPACL
jgi:hypothetical protein